MLEKGQPNRFNAYNSPHEDLREFIKRAEEAGEIEAMAKRLRNAVDVLRDLHGSKNSAS